jgi:hypothetical protein
MTHPARPLPWIAHRLGGSGAYWADVGGPPPTVVLVVDDEVVVLLVVVLEDVVVDEVLGVVDDEVVLTDDAVVGAVDGGLDVEGPAPSSVVVDGRLLDVVVDDVDAGGSSLSPLSVTRR